MKKKLTLSENLDKANVGAKNVDDKETIHPSYPYCYKTKNYSSEFHK